MSKSSPLNIGWNPSLNSKRAMPSEMQQAAFESGRNRGSGGVTHSANDLAIMNTKLTDLIAKWSKKGGYQTQVEQTMMKELMILEQIHLHKMEECLIIKIPL